MRFSLNEIEIRTLVAKNFLDLGSNPWVIADMSETVLVSEGRRLGRHYCTEQFTAKWLQPIGIVQFYDENGEVLRTVNLFEDLYPVRLAA